MHFRIGKTDFLNGLNIASRAISINSPLPALLGIKIEAKDNRIQLTASDSDISIKTCIEVSEDTKLEILDEGEIVLEARYILDMVRKIDADVVEIEIMDGSLTKISGNSVNFELTGIKASNYPIIDFSQPQENFTIKSDIMKDIISQTCFATSDKETRPVLTGLNLCCEDSELICTATDSFRLAKKVIQLPENHNFNITIPARSLNEVARIVANAENINLALSDKKALFTIGDVVIQTRLIDGTYPETARLIPDQFDYELVVDARDMLNAIDRASFIKNDGVSVIKMEMSESEIVLSSRSNEVGSTEQITPISYNGAPLSISYRGRYVYEAIRALNTFQVKIHFCGDMKPFILTAADNDDVLQLVLPMRTYA
jgi:DNA polymerase-3 subunit beta